MNDAKVNEFLDSITKPSTKASYKTSMKFYLEFVNETNKNPTKDENGNVVKIDGQKLLDIKKDDTDKQVEKSMSAFKKWILETKKTMKGKSYSSHFAVSCVMTARSFYDYYGMPLVFRKQEAKTLKESSRTTKDYLFDKEDLTKMALVGNLKERYVLLVGKSVGLRASDFTEFTFGTFRSLKLDNEPPISIGETNTQKETVKAFPFLDSDAIPIVKQILESNKDKADSDKVIQDTEDNLSIILQTLAKKAGMEINEHGTIHDKRVWFHCLRKFLIDHLSAFASESQWKQIVGKTIDEGAYISQDQLRGIFLRAMPSILINGNGLKAKKLMELENALKSVESENATAKTRIDQLQKTVTEQETKIIELNDYVSGFQDALADLQRKHPDISKADLQPLETAINKINIRMNLITAFLEKQGFKLSDQP
jgi:uncharacterized coiled-coil protein SlyX